MDLNEIVKYYQDLLIIQYHHKPKARAVIGELIKQIASNAQLFEDIKDAFNIETAVGKQLDIVAKYFGIKRTWAKIEVDGKCFDFKYIDPTYEAKVVARNGVGYQTINNRDDGFTQTLLDTNTTSYELTDIELRTFIKLRMIALANEKVTYEYLYDEMFRLFNLKIIPVVVDDMTIKYYFDSSLTMLLKVLHTYPEYLPAPAGVGVETHPMSELSDTKYFTFKSLTTNGGQAYNRFQIGFQQIGKTNNGVFKHIE